MTRFDKIESLSTQLDNQKLKSIFQFQCIQLGIIHDLLIKYDILFEELTFEFLLELWNKELQIEQL
jgi:hypothetical protein